MFLQLIYEASDPGYEFIVGAPDTVDRRQEDSQRQECSSSRFMKRRIRVMSLLWGYPDTVDRRQEDSQRQECSSS